jgi:hypothetical protein
MPLQFDFYSTDEFGERLLLDVQTAPELSVAEARVTAESVMEGVTFTEGRADHCVIKNEEGNTIVEVINPASQARGLVLLF